MATLVLTTVGTLIAGPVGGALGALAGQQIDARLFAPKARHGPRLGDLAVQTSAYGTQIPKLFGRMRVAGTVIWATDIQESRSRSGGGKGRPRTVEYSYSASFAVALSARPIRRVERIWADGKLLRGAAGDWKTDTGFRLHLGSEDQEVDPLIASVEGAAQAPAHRGLAYAVFEALQLADFGNRIPSLSFEVVADEEPVSAGTIADALSGGAVVAGDSSPAVAGYAASGDSQRSAIQALAELVPMSLRDDGERLVLGRPGGAAVVLGADEIGTEAGTAGGRPDFVRRSGEAVPGVVTLTHYDPARDYQSGMQRAVRLLGGRTEQRAVAAALDASSAKAFAEERLASAGAARSEARVHLPWRRCEVSAGSLVQLSNRPGHWRVVSCLFEGMIVSLELERIAARGALAAASGGRLVREPDVPHGPTRVLLLDVPAPVQGAGDGVPLLVAAAGLSPGWRRAALEVSFDGGASWTDAGAAAAPAVIGHAESALPAGSSALFDARHAVVVQLLHDGMWLEGRGDLALVAGDNAALLGDEIVQFGRAEALGGGRFRLSRLLRGRHGTEWAGGLHEAGERFVLLASTDLRQIMAPLPALGTETALMARGTGDGAEAAQAVCRVSGEALRPPSPVHLTAHRAGGDLQLSWVRRSRVGWSWLDGTDAPLGEEREAYRVTIAGAAFQREWEVTAAGFTYTQAMQGDDGASLPLAVRVEQLGTLLPSRAATLIVTE